MTPVPSGSLSWQRLFNQNVHFLHCSFTESNTSLFQIDIVRLGLMATQGCTCTSLDGSHPNELLTNLVKLILSPPHLPPSLPVHQEFQGSLVTMNRLWTALSYLRKKNRVMWPVWPPATSSWMRVKERGMSSLTERWGHQEGKDCSDTRIKAFTDAEYSSREAVMQC